MKDITKSEPTFYTEFIQKNKPVEWNDIAPIREQLRDYMLTHEQNHQCAYTELRLEANNTSSHTDHFKRQGLFPAEKFNYLNLFTADKHPAFGASHKDSTVVAEDYNKMLHPHHDNITGRFKYNIGSGEIELTDQTDNRAEFTIQAFNLNHVILKERRKATAAMVVAYKDQIPVEDTIEYLGEFESLVRYIYANEYN